MLSKILLETLLFNVIYLSKTELNSSKKNSSNGLFPNKISKINISQQVNTGISINSSSSNNNKSSLQHENVDYRFSSHKYTLVLDLDETLIHFFYVSLLFIYVNNYRLIQEECSL